MTALSSPSQRLLGCGSSSGQRGFTLLEVMLAVGIMTVLSLALFAFSTRRHGDIHTAALEFQAIVSAARAVAASTNEGPGNSGATIQVRRESGETTVSIFRYRPLAEAAAKPLPETGAPVLRTPAEIRLGDATTFAVFISSSGHSAAQPDYDLATGGALATEPACDSLAGISIAFRDGADEEADRLTCEMAQLEFEPN
jgi:prepilin-type N-terminal cleavage/methylation domain-containing protein